MKAIKNILMSATLVLTCACSGQTQKADDAEAETACQNVVIETIMARRSVRQYTDQPVEREKLQLIADCGINAPNGMNKQPWEVRIVDNADYINGVTELFVKAQPRQAEDPSFKNMFRNGTAVIFIATPKDGSGQVDCGLMAENMILAAQSLGLGTCCLGGPIHFLKTSEEAKPYLDQLGVSEDYELQLAIAVGYPAEAPEAKPRDAAKVKFVD